MPYGNKLILGGLGGLAIARSTDPALEGSQAARVTGIAAFLGSTPISLPISLLIAKVVADQEAESLRPVIVRLNPLSTTMETT